MLSSDLQFPYSTQKAEAVARRASDIAQVSQFHRYPYCSATLLHFLYRSLTQGKHRFVALFVPYYSESLHSLAARAHPGHLDTPDPFPLRMRFFLLSERAL